MKIKKIDLNRLRNEEHFQFHTDFNALTESNTPSALGIEAGFAAYQPLYNDESEALDLIRRSAVTADISAADALRDRTFRGLRDTVKSATSHFLVEKQQAALHILVVLDHYGDLARKSYDEETAAIGSLIGDLAELAADVTLLGLTDWVAELQANNQAFDTLKKTRYTEAAGKTQLRMKQVRRQVDDAYNSITERIDALVIVNGAEAYTTYINELNERIESYSKVLAQRIGRNAKSSMSDVPSGE